jgi:hypothetical protein
MVAEGIEADRPAMALLGCSGESCPRSKTCHAKCFSDFYKLPIVLPILVARFCRRSRLM